MVVRYEIAYNCVVKGFEFKLTYFLPRWIHNVKLRVHSLVNADSFYTNFTNTTYSHSSLNMYHETNIPSLTRISFIFYELIPLNLLNTKFNPRTKNSVNQGVGVLTRLV